MGHGAAPSRTERSARGPRSAACGSRSRSRKPRRKASSTSGLGFELRSALLRELLATPAAMRFGSIMAVAPRKGSAGPKADAPSGSRGERSGQGLRSGRSGVVADRDRRELARGEAGSSSASSPSRWLRFVVLRAVVDGALVVIAAARLVPSFRAVVLRGVLVAVARFPGIGVGRFVMNRGLSLAECEMRGRVTCGPGGLLDDFGTGSLTRGRGRTRR